MSENGTQVEKGNRAIIGLSARRAPSAVPEGNHAMVTSDQGSSAFRILTAECLSPGCLDDGLYAAVVSAFTPATRRPVDEQPLRNSSPQCIAMKAWLGATSSLAWAGTRIGPRLEVT